MIILLKTNNMIMKKHLFAILTCLSLFSVKSQTVLINQPGMALVNNGGKFYDAGGPTGNDGNTSYTKTLCPSTPGEMVALDFVSFKTHFNYLYSEEDALFIYNGTSATGNDIGKLMGDYSAKYNTGVTPYAMGVEPNGSFPLISTPTIFSSTDPSGCLTLKFLNGYSGSGSTWPGWEANIITYPLITPGCNITLTADKTSICPGETVNLTSTGALSSAAMNNNFNNSSIGTNWQSSIPVTFTNNACTKPNIDGSIYVWMQNNVCPRTLATNSFNVSNGGTISFDYRQATGNGNGSPCEAPDQNGGTFEGVYVQYSTNGGTTWTTFKYLYPNATEGSFGSEGGLTGCGDYVKNWTTMTYPIPTAAKTANTQFRWIQSICTDASSDNWGLDNVIISTTKPTTIRLKRNAANGPVIASSTTSPLNFAVNPTVTTTYFATISDGVDSCTQQITVTVGTPSITATPSVCNSANNTYSVSGALTLTTLPTTGTLTITSTCGGTFTTNAPFTSPINYTITGLPSNGSNCTVNATFSANTACNSTVTFTAPASCATSCPTASISYTGPICSSVSTPQTVTLTGTGTYNTGTYSISPTTNISINSSTGAVTPTALSSGTYTITYSIAAAGSCPLITASTTLVINQTPTITVSNTTICNGANATITATPSTTGGTYLWTPGGATTASITVTPSSSTSYSCVYTLNGCPSSSVSGTITVNNAPTITVSNTTICNGANGSITATPSTTGGTYLWTPGNATTASITVNPTSTTSYACVYTLNGCPSASVSGTVTVNPAPTITVSNATICNGSNGSITATPSSSGGTYLWTPGNATTASITVNPSSTTSYACVYTLNGCPSTSVSGTVTVNPAPTITVSNTTICNGANGSISATPSATGGTYLWTPGNATTASITVNPTSTTSYACVYTLNGCPSASVSGTITVNPAPTITVSNATICNGANGSITATPSVTGGTYLWTPGNATTASITVNPTSTTSYACVYTLNGCPSASVSGTVTVNPAPTITVSNATICNGANGSITATPSATGGTYLWSPGNATTASISVNPSSTTSYACVYTLNGCPSSSVSGTITVNPIPTISIPNSTICAGGSGTLTATPSTIGGSYLWSPGGETTNSISYSPSSSTSYSCVYTLNSCPSTSVSADIIVTASPTMSVSNSTICEGSQGTITATPSALGGTYTWNTGATTASINVSPTTTTTYTLTYSYTGCPILNGSGTITVNPIPTLTTSNATVCNGTAATITATPSSTGGTYLWSPGGETSTSISVSPSSTTSYSCVYTLNSCPSLPVSGTVTVNPIPTVTISSTSICAGASANVVATPSTNGGTYLWSPNGETTNSISVNPSTTTSYSCIYTLNNCPSNSSTGTITVNPTPTISINNASVCNGTAATLIATPSSTGGTFLWSPGNASTSSINVTPASTTTYNCVYTLNGCPSSSESGIVTVSSTPTITVSNTSVCNGTAGTITATPSNPGGTYLWSPNGETTNSISASPTTNSNYSCIYTLNGCPSQSVSGTITVNPLPTATITGNTSICAGNSSQVTFSGTPNSTITYTLNSGTNQSITLDVNGTGTLSTGILTANANYSLVSVTSSNSPFCSQNLNSTALITVNPIPTPSFNASVNQGCTPLTVIFYNTTTNITSSSWSFGNGNTSSNNSDVSTTYTQGGCYDVSLTVTSNGCSNTVTMDDIVCVDTRPIANFLVNPNQLSDIATTADFFNSSENASSYQWSFGDGSQSTLTNPSHDYNIGENENFLIQLIAFSANGCSDTTIEILPIVQNTVYYVPNSFTPDGDKYNNEFKPVFNNQVSNENYSMMIFNRWGELIFESKDKNKGWNGTFENKICQTDTYIWKIIFSDIKNDDRKQIVGHVNLLK